jgi:hypothetical protein
MLAFIKSNRADPTVVEMLGPPPPHTTDPTGIDELDGAVSDPEEQLCRLIREGTLTAGYLEGVAFDTMLKRLESRHDQVTFDVIWAMTHSSPAVFDLLMDHPRFRATVLGARGYLGTRDNIVLFTLMSGDPEIIDHVLVNKRDEEYVRKGIENVLEPERVIRLARFPDAVRELIRLKLPGRDACEALLREASKALDAEVIKMVASWAAA